MMSRTFVVAKHEVGTALRRRSFWLMTVLFPLLILGLSLGNNLVSDLAGDSLDEVLSEEPGTQVTGYVDESGRLDSLPPGVPAEMAPRFESEGQARAAVESGSIDGYYLLPEDYPISGEAVLVQEEVQPLTASLGPDPLFRYLEAYALTGDTGIAAALVDPGGSIEVEVVGEAPSGTEPSSAQTGGATGVEEGAAGDDEGVAESVAGLVPYAMLFVLFFVITSSSSYLLQSVTTEKENRTAEVLLVALDSRQLMMGKILGLGAVALLQLVIWAGGGVLALLAYLDVADLESVGLTPGLLAWLAAFLILAHLAYGSMLAALGALVPSQREGTQFMFLVLLPLMVPLWFNYTLISDPHGPLSVGLSLFPLSAPVAMVTRLAAGGVPWWQPVVAAGGLALTGYLFVLLAARIFRADRLLSLESLRWNTLGRAAAALRARG